MIARLLLNLILLIVTFVFLYSGICKITPSLNPDTYIMLEEKFRSSITPVWEKVVKESGYVQYFKIDSHKFKTALGFFEVLLIIISWLGTTGSVIGGEYNVIILTFNYLLHLKLPFSNRFDVNDTNGFRLCYTLHDRRRSRISCIHRFVVFFCSHIKFIITITNTSQSSVET